MENNRVQECIAIFAKHNGKSEPVQTQVTVSSHGLKIIRVWNSKTCVVFKYETKEVLKTYKMKGS